MTRNTIRPLDDMRVGEQAWRTSGQTPGGFYGSSLMRSPGGAQMAMPSAIPPQEAPVPMAPIGGDQVVFQGNVVNPTHKELAGMRRHGLRSRFDHAKLRRQQVAEDPWLSAKSRKKRRDAKTIRGNITARAQQKQFARDVRQRGWLPTMIANDRGQEAFETITKMRAAAGDRNAMAMVQDNKRMKQAGEQWEQQMQANRQKIGIQQDQFAQEQDRLRQEQAARAEFQGQQLDMQQGQFAATQEANRQRQLQEDDQFAQKMGLDRQTFAANQALAAQKQQQATNQFQQEMGLRRQQAFQAHRANDLRQSQIQEQTLQGQFLREQASIAPPEVRAQFGAMMGQYQALEGDPEKQAQLESQMRMFNSDLYDEWKSWNPSTGTATMPIAMMGGNPGAMGQVLPFSGGIQRRVVSGAAW